MAQDLFPGCLLPGTEAKSQPRLPESLELQAQGPAPLSEQQILAFLSQTLKGMAPDQSRGSDLEHSGDDLELCWLICVKDMMLCSAAVRAQWINTRVMCGHTGFTEQAGSPSARSPVMSNLLGILMSDHPISYWKEIAVLAQNADSWTQFE